MSEPRVWSVSFLSYFMIVDWPRECCYFHRFRCKSYILRNIAELGFSEPTPIQSQAIPVLLSVCLLVVYEISIFTCERSLGISFYIFWRKWILRNFQSWISPVWSLIFKQGRECFACAPTGSGKTLAFVCPMLIKLKVSPFAVYAFTVLLRIAHHASTWPACVKRWNPCCYPLSYKGVGSSDYSRMQEIG